jgi:cysteine synthase
MRALGAKVILTPAAQKGTGMVKKAKELSESHGWFLARQFENDANPSYHANTTGPEILKDFAGKTLTHFVTGYGTGGTLQGVGKMLKTARPDIKIVVTEPAGAPLLSGEHGMAAQKREADGSSAETHPSFTPHPIQGWTPDFVPIILKDAADAKLIDEIITVTGPDAIKTALYLASKEGIFTGISGGGSMASALDVARKVRAIDQPSTPYRTSQHFLFIQPIHCTHF